MEKATELDNNVASQLYLGPIGAQNIALFGDNQASKTSGGLWPSDHASVAAQLVIGSR